MHDASSCTRQIGAYASQALLEEASLEGKPGLVCPSSSGAHQDMCFSHFQASACALRPYFCACARAGMNSSRAELPLLLSHLRPLGLEAEAIMYRATGGINTHKGAIFSIGLAAAAAGYVIANPPAPLRGNPSRVAAAIRHTIMRIAGEIVTRELPAAPASAGLRQFQKYGVTGARGQAQTGYPLVFRQMLPYLLRKDTPSRRLSALLFSISALDDTCLLSRGGLEGIAFMQRRAREVLECGGGGGGSSLGAASLARFCEEAKQRRLSPGGSADMLALTLFLRKTIAFTQRFSRKEYSDDT
ncbi:MAG: triphosphoribosyl-dephospho-CoA synthase, partial [Rectinema sp.]|nr:triphosphoribosyl-dephospho-CoA synthase [Rectinema sp.]